MTSLFRKKKKYKTVLFFWGGELFDIFIMMVAPQLCVFVKLIKLDTNKGKKNKKTKITQIPFQR